LRGAAMAKRTKTRRHSQGLNVVDVIGLILIISLLTFALAAVAAARRGGGGEDTWEWMRGSTSRFGTFSETGPATPPIEQKPTS
jgi:hypothetical protein